MPDGVDSSLSDAEFLEALFDRAVERLEDDRPVTDYDLLDGREHLRLRVEELIRLARQVAVGPAAPLPTLRGYTILGELGRGGMGTVFLARQERLGGRPVALKVLPPLVALSTQARERFHTEAKAIARLRHPNIVAVHDVVEDHGVYAYAMEWVEGLSLAQVIDRLSGRAGECGVRNAECGMEEGAQRVPHPSGVGDRRARVPPEPTTEAVRAILGAPDGVIADATYPVFVCRIGIAIGRALSAVHAAGLLHRDVKPSNILLRRDGTPLLSDFGLVREADATVTQPGRFAGTPAYAPPEQLRGESERMDARSDVYALGATLYHALALRPAFRGQGSAEVLRKIEAGAAEPLRRANRALPRDLETIVANAMDPEPARRYPTADELADDLERLLNLQPIKARTAGMLTRSLKLMRRKRGALIGGVVGGSLALAAAVAFVVYVFVVPGWVAGHVADARLALLDPDQALALHWTVFRGRADQPIPSSQLNRPALTAALGHYEAALLWSPFDEAIRAEREAVRSVSDQGTEEPRDRGDESRNQSGERQRPVSVRMPVATESVPHPRGVGHPQLPSVPRTLDPSDPARLRLAGLRAFVLRDVDTAVAAWTEYEALHDQTRRPDPFVAAALGLLYLAQDQPARAYPRLRDAVQGFPDVGFLSVYLADAAVRCGDLAEARRLLDQAKAMPRRDAKGGLERVEADLAVAEGRTAEAEALYREVVQRDNPIAGFSLARLLERTGRLEVAIREYRAVCDSASSAREPREAFVACADRWWDGLSLAERLKRLRAALDENPFSPDSLVGMLRGYISARERIDRSFTPSPRSGEGERSPVGTAENSPAFQRWVKGREGDWSPVGTTETSAVPDGTGMTFANPEPSDESLGYSHSVPPARPPVPPSWLRGFVPSWLSSDSPALSAPFVAPSLQRVTLTQLARILEVQDMSRWLRIARYPRVLKELQFWAWLSPAPQVASQLIEGVSKRMVAFGAAAVLTMFSSAWAQTAQYQASQGTLPEAQGWTFFDDGISPAPSVSNGVLH